jgi:hypothetical protein
MQGLFDLLALLPLPVWLGMILFPKTRFTQRLVTANWTFIILSAVCTLLFLIALPSGFSFNLSVDGLGASFSHPWMVLVGWAYYLTLDLFCGVWIFRDAKYYGINPTLFLLATLFLGPIGLGGYLVLRQHRSRSDPIHTLN